MMKGLHLIKLVVVVCGARGAAPHERRSPARDCAAHTLIFQLLSIETKRRPGKEKTSKVKGCGPNWTRSPAERKKIGSKTRHSHKRELPGQSDPHTRRSPSPVNVGYLQQQQPTCLHDDDDEPLQFGLLLLAPLLFFFVLGHLSRDA